MFRNVPRFFSVSISAHEFLPTRRVARALLNNPGRGGGGVPASSGQTKLLADQPPPSLLRPLIKFAHQSEVGGGGGPGTGKHVAGWLPAAGWTGPPPSLPHICMLGGYL